MDDIKDGLNILAKKIQKNQFKELSYNDNKDIFVGEYYYSDLLELCDYEKYSLSDLKTEDYFKLIQKNLMSGFLHSNINSDYSPPSHFVSGEASVLNEKVWILISLATT